MYENNKKFIFEILRCDNKSKFAHIRFLNLHGCKTQKPCKIMCMLIFNAFFLQSTKHVLVYH